MSNNDGGPAFPNATTEAVFIEALGRYDYRLGPPSGGMSLRDYFAGQVLAGATQGRRVPLGCGTVAEIPVTGDEAAIANACYRIADAMLEERGK